MADKVKNKVILFFPGRFLLGADPQLPLSVLALAGPLMDHGFETVIIDGRVDKWRSRFVEELDDNVLFVGFTALTSDMILYGLEASKWVRQFKPDIRIVWGGVHASLLPEQTIETGEVIDIVARGEGEDIIVNLASAIRSGSKLEDVFGLTFRNNEGKIVSNPDPPNRVDLEKLNLPPYHILDLSKYSMRNFMYMSARGCPHKCQFCDVMAFHHRRYSAKSVQKTLDELEYIIKTYHPESIEFVDDNFFVRRERALEICQGIIDRGLKFEWIASCRADYFKHMNDQYWETVRDAGAKAIYIGAESGSVRTLKEIEKGITIEDVYNAAEQLSRVGIKMSCNFIIGFPHETEEDIKATISLAKELETRYGDKGLTVGGVSIYAPYPGSPMYYKVQGYGFKPPQRLADWGNLILNDLQTSKWHPLVRYFHNVAIVSRWKGVTTIEQAKERIRNREDLVGKFKEFVRVSLSYLASKRWEKMKFGFPIDIKISYFVSKYILKTG